MPTGEADFCPCCAQSPCRDDLESAPAAAPETPSFPGQFEGDYRVPSCGGFDHYGSFGYVPIRVDSDAPTAAQIDLAIIAAFAEVGVKRQQHEAEAAEKAAQEARVSAAREVLADELAALIEQRDMMIRQRDEAIGQRDTLAEFLASMPDDALRGAVKKAVQQDDDHQITKYMLKIEEASPRFQIFETVAD